MNGVESSLWWWGEQLVTVIVTQAKKLEVLVVQPNRCKLRMLLRDACSPAWGAAGSPRQEWSPSSGPGTPRTRVCSLGR